MPIRRLGAGLALMLAGALFSPGVQAAPIGGLQETKRMIDPHVMVEKAQVFIWSGRRYCYYWGAWNGPGWYYCGYAWRRGYGWGGGPGWHGWRHNSRAWHRRNRGWDRGPSRRGAERRSGERRSIDRGGRSGSDRVYRGKSGRDGSFSGRSGRSDGGRSMNRGGGDGGGRGMSSGRSGGGSMSGGGGRGGGGGGGRGGDGGGRGR